MATIRDWHEWLPYLRMILTAGWQWGLIDIILAKGREELTLERHMGKEEAEILRTAQ